ncbi:MAG: Ig-like domain-containing protein [Gemmatimonadetes bacterium]|nr:Ig-like domain-containing protein [Gemmatimonadota bacterium]MCY3943866.1 Ig-like domain-containing protein [Gemmatimonadota bacterium]
MPSLAACRSGLLAAAALFLAVACGTDPPVADSVTVSPGEETLAMGATIQMTAKVADENGDAIADAGVTWSSSDDAVATVSDSGLVTAVASGTTTVTATSGSAKGMATVTVEEPAIVTDGDSFELTKEEWGGHTWYTTAIPYSFTNRTGSKVYLPNCRGGFEIKLEVEAAGDWIYYWSPILLNCLSPPIVIEPDEVYQGFVDVLGCTSGGSCAPRLTLPRTDSTAHRIVWTDALSSYDEDGPPWGDLIPLEERVSNHFTLVVVSR